MLKKKRNRQQRKNKHRDRKKIVEENENKIDMYSKDDTDSVNYAHFDKHCL